MNTALYTLDAMPRPASRRKPAAQAPDTESLGQRLARLRRDRGLTQVELAEKMGLIQGLVSDYELDKLRPNPDILVRYARALRVSADELLGLTKPEKLTPGLSSVSRRFLRRLQQIDTLPKRDQDALLRTIDVFLSRGRAA